MFISFIVLNIKEGMLRMFLFFKVTASYVELTGIVLLAMVNWYAISATGSLDGDTKSCFTICAISLTNRATQKIESARSARPSLKSPSGWSITCSLTRVSCPSSACTVGDRSRHTSISNFTCDANTSSISMSHHSTRRPSSRRRSLKRISSRGKFAWRQKWNPQRLRRFVWWWLTRTGSTTPQMKLKRSFSVRTAPSWTTTIRYTIITVQCNCRRNKCFLRLLLRFCWKG